MTATGYIGGDPTKVDVDGWTQGDILAADAAGELVALPIGAATEVLTVDLAQAARLAYDPAAGGGAVDSVFGRVGDVTAQVGDYTAAQVGAIPTATLATLATKPVVRQSRITSGNVAFPNTAAAWQRLAALDALPVPAAIGDFIEVSFTALFDLAADSFLDVAVWDGAAIARFLGSGTSTPLVEGNPGLYPDPAFNGYFGPQGFTVAAADLNGGNVQVALAVLATGSGQALASAAFPFAWIVKNLGPVS